MSSPLKKDSTLQVTEQEGVVLSNVRRGGGFKQVSLLRVTECEDLICWIKRIDSGVSTLQVREEQRRIGLVVSTQVALPGHGSERIATVPYKSRFSVTIAINDIQHG